MDQDAIFAIASGAGRAAIAVLRVSGPATRQIVESVSGSLPQPRFAELKTFRDPVTGEAIDKGLVIFFPGRKVLQPGTTPSYHARQKGLAFPQ